MKRLIAGIAIMSAAAAIFTPAAAQDTIKTTDVSTQFAPGNVSTTRFDKTPSPINIGKRGSSSWDFSGLRNDSAITFKFIAVAGSPFASNFPTATHAFQTNLTIVLEGIPITATAYVYFQLTASGLLNSGEGANGTGGWTGSSAVITNMPADLFYKLPSTYGTTWTSTFLDTTAVNLGGLSLPVPSVRHFATYVVDAFGPLTLPGGGLPHQVLRIKKTDSTVTYSSGTLTFSKGVGYIFLARDGTLIQVSAQSTTGPDSGMVAIYPPVSWAAPVNTSAPVVAAALPATFTLEQNYPNPFNPSTVIAYAVPVRSSVRLAVYNVLGQLVAELVNGDVEGGSHTVQWNPSTASGVYFCRMDAVALDKSAATFSKVQKMTYVR